MDTSKWRPTESALDAVGDRTIDSGDWRAQQQRKRTMNKIMDSLKMHLPFSGHEGLEELKDIVERVEEGVYTASTSQSEYSRKICFMMLGMETRLQNPMSDLYSKSIPQIVVNPSVPLDWQKDVYQKIEAMMDSYQLQRKRTMKKILNTLKRHLPFTGIEGQCELKLIAERVEEVIYTAATSQSEYSQKICSMMLAMETRLQTPVLDPMQSNSAANCVNPTVQLDLATHTVKPSGGDWQEEVYQKLEALKDLYLQESRPPQGAGDTAGDFMESGDWRTKLQSDSRERIVNKILDTLKRHLPYSGDEGLQELKKIAARFEEKTYIAATSRSDYLRTLSLKMLNIETRPRPDPAPLASTAISVNPGSQVMQQVNNQGQQLPISVPSNNIQQGQQMMSRSINSIGSSATQGSSGQNSNIQSIQNMYGVEQNNVGNTMGNNNFANYMQIPGRQQLVPQQQQPQIQNSHYLYQRAQQRSPQPSMQPHIHQQQQQQNMLQPGQQQQQRNMLQPSLQARIRQLLLEQHRVLQLAYLQQSQQSLTHPSMSQSTQHNIGSSSQGSSSSSSALPSGSGLQQPTMPNVAGQNSNMQNIQNMYGDWRAEAQLEREVNVNRILEILKRHLPYSGEDGLQELKRIAVRFEEKIYTAATSQSDYLGKISSKVLSMETRSQVSSVNSSYPGIL